MADQQKTFFLGIAVDMFGIPLNMVLGFVVVPLYLVYLTAEQYGRWTTIFEASAALVMTVTCFDLWVTRRISGRGGEEAKAKAAILEGAGVLVLFLILLSFILVGCWFYQPQWLQEGLRKGEFSFYGLIALWLILAVWAQLFTAILGGLNRMPLVNGIAVLSRFSYITLPLWFLSLGQGLLSFAWGYAITSFFVLLWQAFLVWPQGSRWFRLTLSGPLNWREAWSFSWQALFSRLGVHFYNYTNILFIAALLSTVQVAVYALSMKLTNFIRFIVPRMVAVGYPSFARLLAEDNQTRMTEVFLKLYRFSLRLGLGFAALVIFLNESFLRHWVGSEFYAGGWFSLFAGLICLKESVFVVFYQVFFASERVKGTQYIFLFEWLLHLILAYWWLTDYGLNGAVMAGFFSTGLVSLGYFFYKLQQIIPLSTWVLLRSAMQVLLKSLPSLGVLFFARLQLATQFNWFLFFAWLALAGVVNLVFFEALYLRELKGKKMKEVLRLLIDRS